jgi:hypothetical protein
VVAVLDGLAEEVDIYGKLVGLSIELLVERVLGYLTRRGGVIPLIDPTVV